MTRNDPPTYKDDYPSLVTERRASCSDDTPSYELSDGDCLLGVGTTIPSAEPKIGRLLNETVPLLGSVRGHCPGTNSGIVFVITHRN